MTIMRSSKSRRTLPTQRSAIPFCQGLRNAVRTGWEPIAFTVETTSALNFESSKDDLSQPSNCWSNSLNAGSCFAKWLCFNRFLAAWLDSVWYIGWWRIGNTLQIHSLRRCATPVADLGQVARIIGLEDCDDLGLGNEKSSLEFHCRATEGNLHKRRVGHMVASNRKDESAGQRRVQVIGEMQEQPLKTCGSDPLISNRH